MTDPSADDEPARLPGGAALVPGETPLVGHSFMYSTIAFYAADDPVAQLADRDELDRAFARLTPDQRSILTLIYYRDLTVPEAAAVIGTPLGTAKSRLHRALDALRAALAAERRTRIKQEMGT